MPYTNDPQNKPADRVRFLLGDTSTTSPDLSDNEIAYLLSEAGDNALRAAARGAELAAAKFISEADERRVGPLTIKKGMSKSGKYAMLAKSLWGRAYIAEGRPYAGGTSRTDKAIRQADGDRVTPAFSRGMMRYGSMPVEGSIDERLG